MENLLNSAIEQSGILWREYRRRQCFLIKGQIYSYLYVTRRLTIQLCSRSLCSLFSEISFAGNVKLTMSNNLIIATSDLSFVAEEGSHEGRWTSWIAIKLLLSFFTPHTHATIFQKATSRRRFLAAFSCFPEGTRRETNEILKFTLGLNDERRFPLLFTTLLWRST